MNSNTASDKFWNDSDCTVSEDYNESPSTNNVYKWHSRESILVSNNKGNQNSNRGISEIKKIERIPSLEKPSIINSNQQSHSCKASSQPEFRLALKEAKNANELTKTKKVKKFTSLRVFSTFKKSSEANSWKEKCNNKQKIDSPRMMMTLRNMSEPTARRQLAISQNLLIIHT
ncbi:unnamed protein product [Moneuplotes crassus]|uniref:Uncharacterized protein n=1 Tax=Euplotes crassus TaxID=5936 RepID=A0AAD1YAS1_EUPCR|nr:unnamed protein product [Moneuplotes crassus]